MDHSKAEGIGFFGFQPEKFLEMQIESQNARHTLRFFGEFW